MAVEVNDNQKIEKLNKAKIDIFTLKNELADSFGIQIESHTKKIENIIDGAIRKERINILNAEIEKIKKGVSND